MYSRLLKFPIAHFARFAKPKPPSHPPNLKDHKLQRASHLHQQNQEFGAQYQFESDGKKLKTNKQQKQTDKKIEKAVGQMIDEGLNQDQILKQLNIRQIDIEQYQGENSKKPEPIPASSGQTANSQEDLMFLQQELMLKQILKLNKGEKGELPLGSRYQQQVNDEQQKFLKKQRILQAIKNKTNVSDLNINEVTAQNRLKESYSNEVVSSADQYRNSELSYFKELIGEKEEELPKNTSILNRRIKKGESYQEVAERDKEEKKNRKTQRQMEQSQRKMLAQKDNPLENIQNYDLIGKSSQQQDIVYYQNENYIQEKAMREFQKLEYTSLEQENISKIGEMDLQASSNLRGILLDEYDETAIDEQYKKQKFEASSFGRQASKMNDLVKRLKRQGIQMEVEELQTIDRELLFQEKQEREEALAYQKYLTKKEKKKKMDVVMKKIHTEKLRDDLDFDVDFKNRFKEISYDPLDIEGNIQKIRMKNLERSAILMPKDKQTEIHFMKTEKNIERFIRSYFYQNFCNPNTTFSEKIQLDEIKYNFKKTLVHIFWSFSKQIHPQTLQKQKQIMQESLTKSSGYISGKMTQLYGFRYGPDIRFYYNEIVSTTEQVRIELAKNKNQVIEYEIRNLTKKGHIKNASQEKQVRMKLEAVAKENIENYHNRNLLLTKKYRKKMESKDKTKKTQNTGAVKNKAESKTAKKSSEAKLWDQIDKL